MHQMFKHCFFACYHSFVHILHVLSFNRVMHTTVRLTGYFLLIVALFLPVFQLHFHGIGPILLASDPLGGN